MKAILFLAVVAIVVVADVHLSNPPGSNNRVDDNNNAPQNRLFDSQNNNQAGYNTGRGDKTQYYVGSKLMMMWTAQHACGVNPGTHCEIIIQYRCDSLMRDGTSRTQPTDPLPDRNSEPPSDQGRHEPYANYLDCKTRERNKGLFTADQNLGGNDARFTRQNNNGGRSGYECPEERDYYPYWHPTLWKDIAVLTDNTTRCQMYQEKSFNVQAYGTCSSVTDNNPASCAQNGNTWSDTPAWGIAPPQCVLAPWSRANIHGDAITPDSIGMEQAHYNFTIPNETGDSCLFRVRYNISTSDYDGWTVDSTSNGKASPVETNPNMNYQINGQDVTRQLSINTAQFGRTFEDRTHIFSIVARPDGIVDTDVIYNLNVRGKRGNNAATYPANEYDFVPNRFHMKINEYVHWQWTGSDNNGNGNDRNDAMAIGNPADTYPIKPSDAQMWMGDQNAAYMAATSCGSKDKNLQDVKPYCNVGLVKMFIPGTYLYMSAKNNNFSNRDEKGAIIVEDVGLSGGAIAGIVVGSLAVVGGGAAAAVVYKKRSAGTSAGRF